MHEIKVKFSFEDYQKLLDHFKSIGPLNPEYEDPYMSFSISGGYLNIWELESTHKKGSILLDEIKVEFPELIKSKMDFSIYSKDSNYKEKTFSFLDKYPILKKYIEHLELDFYKEIKLDYQNISVENLKNLLFELKLDKISPFYSLLECFLINIIAITKSELARKELETKYLYSIWKKNKDQKIKNKAPFIKRNENKIIEYNFNEYLYLSVLSFLKASLNYNPKEKTNFRDYFTWWIRYFIKDVTPLDNQFTGSFSSQHEIQARDDYFKKYV